MLKSNKGITLMSFTIYLIVLSVCIGLISFLQGYLFNSSENISILNKTVDQYSRFLAYITNDLNSGNIKNENTEVTSNTIVFYLKDGAVHKYVNNGKKINFIVTDQENSKVEKNITICSDITSCTFSTYNGLLNTSVEINNNEYKNNFSIGS